MLLEEVIPFSGSIIVLFEVHRSSRVWEAMFYILFIVVSVGKLNKGQFNKTSCPHKHVKSTNHILLVFVSY